MSSLTKQLFPCQSQRFWAAALLFFTTGALGLAYELIWIRKASLIVGASQIALSTVVTALFLGIGIGSYLVGGKLPRWRISPLVLYGLFEIGIGGFALLFPFLFGMLEGAYGALYPGVKESAIALFAVRFFLLLALFLPPTILMGGTLPLLLGGIIRADDVVGSRVSLLYGINILGAVVGVLIASYFAIPRLGLNGTCWCGAVGNLLIGCTAVLLFRNRGGEAAAALAPHQEDTPLKLGVFFATAAFVSGFLSLAYQSAWARYFSLFNTGTVYLTAILLAVYLTALAAGSLLVAPLLRKRFEPLLMLAVAQAAVPILAIVCLGWWRVADYRFAIRGVRSARGQPEAIDTLEIDFAYAGFWRFASETSDAVFCAPLFQVSLVIFLPVTLLGAGLPLLIAARARASDVRSVSGRLIFWNTLGSSAAGFVTGYVFLPLAGLHGTFAALGAASVAFSTVLWVRTLTVTSRGGSDGTRHEAEQGVKLRGISPTAIAWGTLPAAGTICLLVFASGENLTKRTIREAGYGRDPEMAALFQSRMSGRDPLIATVEGPLTTSFVLETPDSLRIGSGNVCLAVSYKNMVSTQVVQGHIPCIFFPGSEGPLDCLGICLGSGQSFGALLLHGIKRLDVVDISPEIIQLSVKHFAAYNHGLSTDARVVFHLDDGRHFVERTQDASYDVISMEPPPPAAEGVYALYSREFYSEAKRVLRPQGVFMQWLPLYRVTPLDARCILKTQAAVFPETFLVKVGNDDFMVVSYKQRPVFRLQSIEARLTPLMGERHVKGARWAKGCRFELASLEGVLSLLLAGPKTLEKLEAPYIYDDDRQILSYSSGDRHLLRRYQGPFLSQITFTALALTPFEELADYFEPRLTGELCAALDEERAASLEFFGVPRPSALREMRVQAADAPPGSPKGDLFLRLAELENGALRKKEAFKAASLAVSELQRTAGPASPEQVRIARAIVRNALAAFSDETGRWLAELGMKCPGSPLFELMSGEYSKFEEREEERKKGYWFE